MPEHVNMMDKSMKRQIEIDHIGEENKAVLKAFLMEHDQDMWNNSDKVYMVTYIKKESNDIKFDS